MKLSTKGRYAMVALADLALQPAEGLASLADISRRQDISLPYLEQLFVKLRRAGLVGSARGPGGGYRLARPASEIRVSDILSAVDETVSAMHTGAGASGAISGTRAQSMANRLWEGLSAHVYVYLHQTRSVGRDRQRPGAVPGGAVVVPGRGRGTMTGPRAVTGGGRVYLDWNATAPLRPEAKAAMVAAMDLVGNPSSVHAEGRAAKALVEDARARIAAAFGADGADIVFTSGATEAAALVCDGRGLQGAGVEHDAVAAWVGDGLPVDGDGRVTISDPAASALQLANSETGVVQDLPDGLAVCDATQGFGRLPVAFSWLGVTAAIVSAHKFGGPKGVGAVILRRGTDLAARIRGGGQEMGRRAGTENLIGIAGMAAAAEAAARDFADGVWERVAGLRDGLEARLAAEVPGLIFAGSGATRLPNTSCLVLPGWKGETQVMQMDLAGIAVSAGSACSSGKVRSSRVLTAMGYDARAAVSAIRVSIGPTTTEADLERFADAWTAAARRHMARAA